MKNKLIFISLLIIPIISILQSNNVSADTPVPTCNYGSYWTETEVFSYINNYVTIDNTQSWVAYKQGGSSDILYVQVNQVSSTDGIVYGKSSDGYRQSYKGTNRTFMFRESDNWSYTYQNDMSTRAYDHISSSAVSCVVGHSENVIYVDENNYSSYGFDGAWDMDWFFGQQLTDAPEISYTLIDDYGTFNVINVPDENADKVHWLITYGSIDGEPQIQTWEGIDIPSKPLEFTFPHIAEKDQDIIYGTYSIRAYYTDENEDRTSNETSIIIKLSENNYNNFSGICTDDDCTDDNSIGSNALSLDFDDCTLSSEYPFIDINGCKNKIGQLLGIMNFDKLKYGSQLKGDTTGCHTLGTIGSWLNLDNDQKLICPKFSDSLRGTVTPFITFGLGLIMIQFIAKRGIDQGGN